MKNIEQNIVNKFNSMKETLRHEKISFSRVEVSSNSNVERMRKNYLLSIILTSDFVLEGMADNLEEISEMVVDVLIIRELNVTDIKCDLSYGNGIIIKEVMVKNVDIENNEEMLNNVFFDSIAKDIYRSLDLLV